jgi:hypothetical protein
MLEPNIIGMIRATWHRRRTGHRGWSENMIWSGRTATVYFCTCGEQFWPKDGPYRDWRDNPVRRDPPE